MARVHSHMCEIGVATTAWQQPKAVAGGVKRQLRDYYVRSLGGAKDLHPPPFRPKQVTKLFCENPCENLQKSLKSIL